ncbi:MAG: endolytic transglycosylase MltG [Candidatus Manganitrophaceae bacterium]
MTKFLFTLLCLTLFVAVGAVGGLFFLNDPPSQAETYKVVEVPEGTTFSAVSDLLKREGLITNRVYFRLLGIWMQSEKKIKPGEYAFHTAMRPTEILDLMVRGKIVQHQVVIPEGATARQIARILEEAKLASSEAFLKVVEDPTLMSEVGIEGENLEGYLFPDTYQFAKRTPLRDIVRRMLMQFIMVYDESLRKRAEEIGMTQQEVMTLASIIEKETGHPSERALIAAVFHNRLKKKMRLQSDPTVIFAMADFNGNITKKDLSIPSPYNTYRFGGLPPGPIANPGKESLRAALYPAEVDYLYFVSRNDGTHFFSNTLREHNGAVNKYQKQPRKRV